MENRYSRDGGCGGEVEVEVDVGDPGLARFLPEMPRYWSVMSLKP